MNILLEPQISDDIREKFLLLELDSFRVPDTTDPVRAYCLVEPFDVDEMSIMQQFIDLHGNLMPNFRKQNWNYVEQAIEHLMGRWGNQLDSFYQELLSRVTDLREQTLDADWDGTIDRRSE